MIYFNDNLLIPLILVRTEIDEASRQAEQYGMGILYQYEIYKWMSRKKYGYNLKKACDLVFSYFSKVMHNIIETCPTSQ